MTKLKKIFWKSEGKHLKLFESKFGHRKLFIKLFSTYLQLKNECCVCLETAFFSFLQICKWQSWNHFLGKWAKHSKLFKSKFGHKKLHRMWIWSYLELKDECSKPLKRASLSYFQSFECRSWNHFLGNWGKAFKTIEIKLLL